MRSWRTSSSTQPRGKEIHVIADNLSAHKTGQVDDFLDRHPKVHLHFTPTYSSWLNQIELWFAKIERDVIARGVFKSVADLRRKLMKYIRHYNNVPKTVKWRYLDPTRELNVTVDQLTCKEPVIALTYRSLSTRLSPSDARRRIRRPAAAAKSPGSSPDTDSLPRTICVWINRSVPVN